MPRHALFLLLAIGAAPVLAGCDGARAADAAGLRIELVELTATPSTDCEIEVSSPPQVGTYWLLDVVPGEILFKRRWAGVKELDEAEWTVREPARGVECGDELEDGLPLMFLDDAGRTWLGVDRWYPEQGEAVAVLRLVPVE